MAYSLYGILDIENSILKSAIDFESHRTILSDEPFSPKSRRRVSEKTDSIDRREKEQAAPALDAGGEQSVRMIEI